MRLKISSTKMASIVSRGDGDFNASCRNPVIYEHYDILKGLRPVLEGFVVTMHEGACETGSQIPRALARGIWRSVRTSPIYRSVLIPIITWHFQFHPVNVSILHLKYDCRARSESRFACYSHYYVTWYPLTTGIVASKCPSARDAMLVTRYLTPFISVCLNTFLRFYSAIKHIYKESANIIEGCNVACDTNDCWNFQ